MTEISAGKAGQSRLRVIFAACIGSALEWYDFFLYGTAAGLVFGKLYFPNEDPLTATLAADHRASDGHRGALFLADIDRRLQSPEKL